MNFFQNIGLNFNKNNKKYIIQEIQKANNVSYIKELIEKANPDIIDYEILDIAVKKGYHINDNTPIPKNSINHLHDYIQNSTNSEYLKFVVENHFIIIDFNDFYLAMQKGYKPSKEAIIKFLETKEKLFSFIYGMISPWDDESKIYGDLPLILSHLDENNISFEALRIATRFGYNKFENTPVLKFNTFEEIKKFFEEYDDIPYEKVQSLDRYSKDGFLLENERYGQPCIVGKIIEDNLDIMTYELLDSIRQKNLYWSTYGKINIKINSKEEMKEKVEKIKDQTVITLLIENSTSDVMDAEIFREAINKRYIFNYDTPKYIFEEEQYKEFVSQEKEKLYKDNNLKNIDYISPYLMDLTIFEKACRNGYEIDEKTPEYIKNNMDYVASYILTESSEYGQNESLKKFVDLSPEQQEKLMFNLIEHNYRINSRTPEIYQKFKYIKEALKKDISHMSYSDTQFIYNSLNDNEKKEVESIILDAMDNIKIVNRIPKSLINFSFIKKLTEKGWMDVMSYPDDYLYIFSEEQQDELILTAIEQGYLISNFFSGVFKIPIKLQYIEKGFECKQFYIFSSGYYLKFTEYIKSLSPNDQERLLFKLIDSGFEWHDSPLLQENKYKIRFMRNGHIDTVWLNIDNLYSEEKKQLNEAISIAIQKGYNFSCTTPNWMRNFKFIKMAIERENDPQPEAIKYLIREEKAPLTEEELELCKMAVQKGYSFYYDTPECMRSFEVIEYAITQEKNPQLNAIVYLNFDNVPEDKKEEVSKWLNEYVLEYDIWDVMHNIINKIKDSDYINSFSQEQLKCFKYLLQYPKLVRIYENELIDTFYKNYLENKQLCVDLFNRTHWNEIIPLFKAEDEMIKLLSEKQLKVITIYAEIDNRIQNVFQDFVVDNMDAIEKYNDEKLNLISEVLRRLSISNSTEMQHSIGSLARLLLNTEDPMDSLDKIEDIFLKNNLPTVGKIYKVFEILYPNLQGFNFSKSSTVSPVLQSKSNNAREIIIFSDLIKSFIGSNNRNFKRYLENLEQGNKLFLEMCENKTSYDSLDDEAKKILDEFVSHLNTLYNNTKKGKEDNRELTGNVVSDIEELKKVFSSNGKLVYNLPDRIIRMYCHFAGIDTLEQAKKYMQEVVDKAEERNIKASEKDLELKQGDFVKGIGGIKYLATILQNGSNAREFLGDSAGSDLTPLDTDMSVISGSNQSIKKTIENTAAYGHGPIFFVLKNRDDRFAITRRSPSESDQQIDRKIDSNKLEAFYTGAIGTDHYGIRTGFASTEIDYIVMENNDPRVGLEIALNGFYIPVADMTGKIIFTYDDYKALRAKMSGLSYYELDKYDISSNLVMPDILETKKRMKEDIDRTNKYVKEINTLISKALIASGMKEVVNGFSHNLIPGIAEIYPTGSTSRNTNVPNDSDFDYVVKIDRDTYYDKEKQAVFIEKMKEILDFSDGPGGKICGRIKKEDGSELDIEISFCPRTDKVEFSTDVSLKDRLDTIKTQYPDSYMDVLANIVYAKELFKSVQAYKSAKSDSSQGGLGGIGVENWILQHGGSLYDAAKNFVNEAEKAGSFEKFCEIYQVYDFGANHYSDKSDIYEHDNFVGDANKMTEHGYKQMLTALKKYIYAYENPGKELMNDLDLEEKQEEITEELGKVR